jgi:hypothetical protein
MKEEMRKLVEMISESCQILKTDFEKADNGNKTAAKRTRVEAMKMIKAARAYRILSLQDKKEKK